MIPEEPNTQHIKFASGVALIFFGIIFLIVGSISFACACCSMVAVRDEFAQQPVIMQQQMTQPYPQQAVYPKQTTACSNPAFCPQPAPSPMYFAQPPNYEQVMQANQTSIVQAPATSGGFPQPPQVPLPCLPDAPSEKTGSAEEVQ
nr:unnamed protein product [Spirometra erinaceieuropaei]